LALASRKSITFYLLAQKLQAISLNVPKTTSYGLVKVNFQNNIGFGSVLDQNSEFVSFSGTGFPVWAVFSVLGITQKIQGQMTQN
jgi:hypothetical protein